MMKIVIMPVSEIADAGLNRAGFDEMGHGLPSVFGLGLSDILWLSRFFEKCDDHRLPFPPLYLADRSRPALLKNTFDC